MPEEGSSRQITEKFASSAQQVELNLAKINQESKEREYQEIARSLGLSYVNISTTPINPDLLKLIPSEKAISGLIIPFYRVGDKLRISCADPNNSETKQIIEDLKNKGFIVQINISTPEGITESLKIYQADFIKEKVQISTSVDEAKIKAYEEEIKALKDLEKKVKNLTAEEAVYLINIGALKTGASDIHFEPEENYVRVRFRIDGLLHKIFEIDRGTYVNISNQIKYQSKMKLNINNIPQDGRYSFNVNERKIDVRASSLPTEFGETFVLRLLDPIKHIVSFEELGFSGNYLKKIEKLTQISHGMILVTGPTGSGKTTSLYAMLSKFNTPDAKIITLEDPIEYNLEGVSQSQINEKRDYSFASGLRAILRQDPDVVMIGEIRDIETAEAATQAALTGHVMLSTLHTNSAIETIPRLINIGLQPFMVAPALNTIIAQRLVRKICSSCQEQKPISTANLEELNRSIEKIKKISPSTEISIPMTLASPVGCDFCSHTGYKGRICIVEMLEIDFEIRDLILNKSSSLKIIEAARRKGMLTMREDGTLKVLMGETTLEEVYRATSILD